MASIARRPNGRWRARYRDSEGREHARHFARKADAQGWLDEQTTARRTGTWVDPAKAKTLVEVEARAWLASHPDWSASTRARATGIVSRWILPRWGGLQLGQVSTEAVQEWVSGMDTSPATVRKIVGVLSGVMDGAIRRGHISANPCHGIALPRQRLARRRYLSVQQVEALAEAAGPHALIVRVLAYTGLRWGEMAALKGRSIDLGRRRLRVEESVTVVGGRLVWSEPKTHQRRTVPWPAFLDGEMIALAAVRGDDELLFRSRRGTPLRVAAARRSWWDQACIDAGVEGLTPHELRHTAASLAVSAGASVLAVQRMLGHSKPSMTLDVYADLFDQDLDAVAESLDALRSSCGQFADSSKTRQ